MKKESAAFLNEVFSFYGANLSDDFFLTKNGKKLLAVSEKGKKFIFSSPSGNVMATTAKTPGNVASFLESFYFWEPLRKNPSKKEPTARQLAKKVHAAIHPLEHKKPRKNASPLSEMTPVQRKMRKAELLAKKTKRLGMAAAGDVKKGYAKEVSAARKQFEHFTGLKAEHITPAPYSAPKTAVVIGKLVAVIYEAERLDVQGYEGEDDVALYKHDFSKKNPPILAVSPDGKQLVIVGGGYHFDAVKGGIIG